ncbi:MAG: TRAP transporter small permease [Rhodospirillaceae bacterium]|nr:TRAP transporter small permease [Rhodospirillaceae bacterium]
MESFFRLTERAAIAAAALAVLATGGLIVGTIVAREVLGRGIPDAEIIVQDLMVVAVMLPLAAVAGQRAHIAVDLFVRRLAPALRRGLHSAIGVLSLLFLLPIVWSGVANFRAAWTGGGYYDGALEIAEWPGRLAFLVGLGLFAARSLHRVFTDRNLPADGTGTE